MTKPNQSDINNTLWAACDTFRGVLDSTEYKNYILVFLFLKYLSDAQKETYETLRKKYGDNEELIQRKMERERFFVSENATFDYLFAHKDDSDIGQKIDIALGVIESQNIEKLEGVFGNVSFNSPRMGTQKDKNRRLKNLLIDFNNPLLDFRPSVIGNEDIIGNAYMFLIERFASGAGKKGGEFYTPKEISELLAKLMSPAAGSRIYDPTCGSGSLLITVAKEVKDDAGERSKNFALYGQEVNGDTLALCKMNLFLHKLDAFSENMKRGNTLNEPQHLEGKNLMKFDAVVANPPFSLDKWGAELAENDIWKRYHRGVPPKSKGDYAFLSHMIHVALAEKGKVGLIVPHGVLFRGSSEGKIRKKLIEENLLEAVIGLPANLFYGTSIPAAIIIFNKGKGANTEVLFIDASQQYEPGKKQNKLRPKDIEKVVGTYENFKTLAPLKEEEGEVLADKYAYRATLAEMAENEFNLNIPRYVDTFVPEPKVDIGEVQKEIVALEKDLVDIRKEMDGYLTELDLI